MSELTELSLNAHVVCPEKYTAKGITSANTTTKQFLALPSTTPHGSMEGNNGLWAVFFSSLAAHKISPGIRKKTEMRLHKMPLASTQPKSGPKPNCISVKASRPEMVVKLEEAISGMA